MNEPDELELSPELRAVESRLRQLKPRAATLDPINTTSPTIAAARSPVWGYALTWVSGVAVGCFAMTSLPASPIENQQSITAAPTHQPAEAVEGNSAQSPLSDLPSESQERVLISHPMAKRIELIAGTKLTDQRLLLGSHLQESLAHAALRSPTIQYNNYVQPQPIESSPKTRNQLLLELLDSQNL